YYCINGKVIKGAGRGKKLGFPTANLKTETQYVLPPSGVYATYVLLRGKRYRSITNFGNKPTFSDNVYSIEVHILDYANLEIYGENLSIELIDFIRPEMTFNSSKELANQIKKDILYTDCLLCYN
ncbi:MAG TPA: riboflavin kinase, partial [Halanaerobiales bacterium]|nr:riboflavin kinase [Halanaerobiales bacterium]